MPKQSNQSKRWCFTVNNYNDEDIELFQSLDCRYIIYGKEVGEQGTPHLQGFVVFTTNKRLTGMKKIHPTAHWEVAIGTTEQSIVYCSKEDPNPFIKGDSPNPRNAGQAIKDLYHSAFLSAKSGKLDDIDTTLRTRHYSTYNQIAKDYMVKPSSLPGPCGLWIYGETGTGKSYSVRTQCPDRYIKPRSKQWDGYQNEEVVHLDEIAPSHTSWIAPYLKDWADENPFHADVKFGAKQIRPKLFIVTSNYSIDQMGFDAADLPAIKRRFREVEKKKGQDIIILSQNKV